MATVEIRITLDSTKGPIGDQLAEALRLLAPESDACTCPIPAVTD